MKPQRSKSVGYEKPSKVVYFERPQYKSALVLKLNRCFVKINKHKNKKIVCISLHA